MANLQPYFEEFHDAIRLDPYDENAELREKRDMLLDELRKKLPNDVPGFRSFNQGSYAMNTGVMPKDGNYDIDVGLVFSCQKDRYPDPVVLKSKVREALEWGNRTVRVRKPCVTVEYLEDGEPVYHVDLAIYVKRADGQGLDLACGREDSSKGRSWQHNDPERLIELVANRFKDEEAAQMRRVIKYLKRWRDHCFLPGMGPISIALTIAATSWFTPHLELFRRTPNDASALKGLVDGMSARFQPAVGQDGKYEYRLQVQSPVAPFSDLLHEMLQADMDMLRLRLKTLSEKLQLAIAEPRPEVACAYLATQFGPDFPTPSPGKVAKTVGAPYVHTGQSA